MQLGKMANGGHKRKQPSSGRQPEAEPELYVQVAALGYDGRPFFVFPDLGDNDSLFKIGSGVADGGSGVVDMSSKIDQTKDMEWYYEANRRHFATVPLSAAFAPHATGISTVHVIPSRSRERAAALHAAFRVWSSQNAARRR